MSTRTGNADIFVMNADGTNQVNITHHPAQDLDPDWSPLTGGVSTIAFTTNRDRNFEIYVMESNGGNARNFTQKLRRRLPSRLEVRWWSTRLRQHARRHRWQHRRGDYESRHQPEHRPRRRGRVRAELRRGGCREANHAKQRY